MFEDYMLMIQERLDNGGRLTIADRICVSFILWWEHY